MADNRRNDLLPKICPIERGGGRGGPAAAGGAARRGSRAGEGEVRTGSQGGMDVRSAWWFSHWHKLPYKLR